MSRIAIASIVEGHGEDSAVRILLERVWIELLGGEYANVLRPIRRSRGKLLSQQSGDLEKAVGLAHNKLAEVDDPGLICILVDAEDDCHRVGPLGPMLLARAKAARGDRDICCVIANKMFETWFIAAADSLRARLNLDDGIPAEVEGRLGKGWIKTHIRTGKYSETVDQPSLTHAMDLALCRQHSRSFDKLCRELAIRLR